MKKFLCWWFGHDWKWQFHDDLPSSLLCKRCGKEQPNGMIYFLTKLFGTMEKRSQNAV